MGTVRVNPDELMSDIKKMRKYIGSYEKNCKSLSDILTSNEAQLDEKTYQAINTAFKSINDRLNAISDNLKKRCDILEIVAKEFEAANAYSSVIATC